MTTPEILNFILDNQEDYEKCYDCLNAELLRREIQGIATTGREFGYIDKEHPIIRINANEKEIDGRDDTTADKETWDAT